jgi:hypothetical protein
MAYSDQFKDTPEHREQMKRAAETYADMQGVNYIVTRAKSDGKLATLPKSMFDPEREEIVFECSGGGQKAADERWEGINRRLHEQPDSPSHEAEEGDVGN